jgi:hypothetical protein
LSNTTVKIAGKEYVYQGVTDLEVMPLAEVFGTERPEQGTKEYRDWAKQFMRKFVDYSSQRAVAQFLRCAFPDIPESIVKYTIRRLPDGTEECRPGIDLRIKLQAKEFEQIVLIITSELTKIEEKLKQDRKPVSSEQLKPLRGISFNPKSEGMTYDTANKELVINTNSELRFNDNLELLNTQESGLNESQVALLVDAIRNGQIVAKKA